MLALPAAAPRPANPSFITASCSRIWASETAPVPFLLVITCQRTSMMTSGAFDIAFGVIPRACLCCADFLSDAAASPALSEFGSLPCPPAPARTRFGAPRHSDNSDVELALLVPTVAATRESATRARLISSVSGRATRIRGERRCTGASIQAADSAVRDMSCAAVMRAKVDRRNI